MALFCFVNCLGIEIIPEKTGSLQQDAAVITVHPGLALFEGSAGGGTAPAAAVGTAAVRSTHLPHLGADGEGGGFQRRGLCKTGRFGQRKQLLNRSFPPEHGLTNMQCPI